MILEAIRLAVPEIWNIYKHRKDKRSQVYNAIETIQEAANRTRFVIASNNYRAIPQMLNFPIYG